MLAGIAILAVVIGLLAFPSPGTLIYEQVLMFFGLYGYTLIALTTLTYPFLKEFVQAFGKPFLSIHHTFAVLGLVFITIHPVLFAIESASALVLLPNLYNWFYFWAFAGSPAIIVLYAALTAALLRRKALMHWKPFHLLVYVTLLFGIIHANVLGRTFYSQHNLAITAIFDGLFAVSIAGFFYKRYQNHVLKKNNQARKHAKMQNSVK